MSAHQTFAGVSASGCNGVVLKRVLTNTVGSDQFDFTVPPK
jgi:hypothetical protein